jgi:hypothetical protein
MPAPATPPVPLTDAPTLAVQELLALLELQHLGDKARAPERTCAKYYDDPLGFIDNCVKFPEPRKRKGGRPARPPGLTPYQREIIAAIPEKQRVAVRGPRGLGKTALASLSVLWFACTRDAAGVDWKIITTAGSWLQLTSYTWVEIKKWAYCLDWDAIGRPPFSERTELMKTGLSLRHGVALASSPDQPARIEGAHSDSLFMLLDEAKIIPTETFDAAEGAFSAAGDDSDLEAYALMVSTPGPPSGRFFDVHRHAEGLEDWHAFHVTLDQAIESGRMSRAWANQRAKLWGVNSALYSNHVLGEFCADDEDAVIPLRWIEAAQDRWRAWDAAGRPEQDGPHVIGVDVARSGSDKTCMAIRHGDVVTEIRTTTKEDTMQTTGRVKGILTADPLASAWVDVIGIGAGVYDRCREQGLKVEPFHAGKKTMRKDRTRQFGFFNLRSCAWWMLRQQLEPPEATLALPPDDELAGDLTALHYKYTSDGRIQVEGKDDIKKRIGRSTDKGDAVMQSAFPEAGSFADAYGLVECVGENCPRRYFYEKDERGKPRTRCPWCGTDLFEDAGDGESTEGAATEAAAVSVPVAIPAQPQAPGGIMLPVAGGLAGLRNLRGLGGLGIRR